jgi:hypothetical protein
MYGMKHVMAILITIISLIVSLPQARADIAHPWRDEDAAKGYSASTDPEAEDTGVILYTVEDPYKDEVVLKDKIFDQKLTKEITARYYEKFGRTEAEIIQNRTPYLNTNFSEGSSMIFNEEDYQKQQSKFGNYVIRRVFEYHFENEAKNNPDLKSVYKAKQKIENVNMSFSENIKLRAKYQISSNTITATVKTPYMNFETRFELADHETVYSMYRDLGLDYSFITDYYIRNPTWDIIGKKALSSTMSLTLTLSPFHTFDTADVNSPASSTLIHVREKRALAGMSYKF